MSTERQPGAWACSKVTLLLKPREKTEVKQFRPIGVDSGLQNLGGTGHDGGGEGTYLVAFPIFRLLAGAEVCLEWWASSTPGRFLCFEGCAKALARHYLSGK